MKHIKARVGWFFTDWLRLMVKRAPDGLWTHAKDIARGALLVVAWLYRFVMVKELHSELKYNRSLASRQGLQVDTREMSKLHDKQKIRWVIVAVVTILSALFLRYFSNKYGVGVPYTLLGSIVVGLDALGHYYRDPEDDSARPITPLREGVSYRMLQTSIKEILLEAKPAVKISFHGVHESKHGVDFSCHLDDKLTDEHIRLLELKLQAGKGLVSILPNPENMAAPTLRLFWTDPLAGSVKPARRAPKSLTCKDPFNLTRVDDGSRGQFSVLGVHQLWLGNSGTGKTNGLQILLDWLVDCKDAEVDGIDLTQAAIFGLYKKVMRKVAYSAEDAHAILDEALALCEERNRQINEGMDADDDGMLDENWVVTEDAPARFIIIDEYTTMVAKDKALQLKAERLFETGRKSRVHLIVGTPSADSKKLGSTVPVNQSHVKVVFKVPFSMIPHILGVGLTDEGWRPDRFEAGSQTSQRDIGKCYVYSPESGKPLVHRFDRLDPADIRERNRERRVISRKEEPEMVQKLRRIVADHDNAQQLKTAQILSHPEAVGYTATSLAAEMRALGLAPKTIRFSDGAAKGYDLTSI